MIRNLAEFPRAFVVHDVVATIDFASATPLDRRESILKILYAEDAIWNNGTQQAYDPHELAWVSRRDALQLQPYLSIQDPAVGDRQGELSHAA